ncbi:MAG: hypothetical protein NTAFB01_36950 [Nitrospira sp.]
MVSSLWTDPPVNGLDYKSGSGAGMGSESAWLTSAASSDVSASDCGVRCSSTAALGPLGGIMMGAVSLSLQPDKSPMAKMAPKGPNMGGFMALLSSKW